MNLQLAMALLTVVILDGFAPCKGTQITETGKILLMESGIQLKESGIPLTIVIQNPSSTDKYWNPVPRIRNLQCGIRNPRLSWIPLLETEFLPSLKIMIYTLLSSSSLSLLFLFPFDFHVTNSNQFLRR